MKKQKVFYKATRPDGKDFHSGTVDYAGALASGDAVKIREEFESWEARCCSPAVLHASTVATDTLIGGSWPCRLFEVEGVVVAQEGNKRGFRSLRVLRELDAGLALGPQAEQIIALIARARELTPSEARRLDAARDAAWDAARGAAWDAARDAAWDAARDAAWGAARGATRDAARGAASALCTRDLIGQHGFKQRHYDALTRPWREVVGPIHPDDAELEPIK